MKSMLNAFSSLKNNHLYNSYFAFMRIKLYRWLLELGGQCQTEFICMFQENPFNMRVVNLNSFPVNSNSYKSSYRSPGQAVHRAK